MKEKWYKGTHAYEADAWSKKDLSTAYYASKYSFLNADVKSLPSKTVANVIEHPDGVAVTWTSREKCKEGFFKAKLTATCSPLKKDAVYSAMVLNGDCEGAFTYDGPDVCAKDIPIKEAMDSVMAFLGVFYIVFGIFMFMAGSKFLFIVFGSIIGLIWTGIFFTLINVIFLPVDATKGLLIGAIFGSVVLGALVAYLTYKFSKAFIVPILAGLTGGMILYMLATTLHASFWPEAILVVIGGAVGVFLGAKFQRYVKAVSTSMIGSFLFVRGIGMYAPGFPSSYDDVKDIKNVGNLAFAYLAGFIVCAAFGIWFQLRHFKDEDDEKFNEMDNEDEGKVCGCL